MTLYRFLSSVLVTAVVLGAAARGAGPAFSAAEPAAEDTSTNGVENLEQSPWWEAAESSIREGEYAITLQDSGSTSRVFHAPNRAQNLRTYFTPGGLQVEARKPVDPSWGFGLALSRWGLGDALAPVQPAKLAASGNRIEYRREGLVEWYVNDERGLEQGFILDGPPPGDGERIMLELELSGSLKASLDTDQAIDLLDENGRYILRYGELKTTDAAGNDLRSSMRLSAHGDIVLIVVEARSAVYPVTIDPLVSAPGWPVEGNQAGAQLGFSLDTAGDVNGDGYDDILVGAKSYDGVQGLDSGRVFLFQGSAGGIDPTVDVTFDGSVSGAQLGSAVDTAGDVNGDGFADIILGSPGLNQAYIYFGRSSMDFGAPDWAGSGSTGSMYGSVVGTAGYVNDDGYADVIIGAPGANSAFVYHGAAASMDTIADWTGTGSGSYGAAAGTAGDVTGDGYDDVIVGAPGLSNGQSGEGAAFVYFGGSGGLAIIAGTIIEGGQAGAGMGSSASGAGDVNGDGYADVVVGSPGANRTSVYFGSAVLLDTIADWTGSGATGSQFGFTAAGSGDVNGDGYSDVIVGAPGANSVYVYLNVRLGNTGADWTSSGSGRFGTAASTAGDVNADGYADLLVGAPLFESASPMQDDEGEAYVYYGGSFGPTQNPVWSFYSGQLGARLGVSVDTAGDVNGDGYDDLIAGAYLFDNGQTDEGMVYLWYGSASGLINGPPDWVAESNQEGSLLGSSVASAGDINGDGYDDIIVGAVGIEMGGGRIYVWFGSNSGLGANGNPSNADWSAGAGQEAAWLGYTVGTAGDVNGDGYGDIIAAAPRYDAGEMNEGAIFVWYGGPGGLPASSDSVAQADWMAESDQENPGTSYPIPSDLPCKLAGTAGDVNGDGYDDVVAGFSFFNQGQTHEGIVLAWYGTANGLGQPGNPSNADWVAEGNQANGEFGSSVSTAGDVNGDGFDDVIVGEKSYRVNNNAHGAAFVWYGSSSGLNSGLDGNPDNANWKRLAPYYWSGYGLATGTAGDVNGDGFSDVIIGGPFYPMAEGGSGIAELFLGGKGGLSVEKDWYDTGHDAGSNMFGYAVGTAGDVNGDGYDEVIIGEINNSSGTYQQGRLFLYYGNNLEGKPVRAQQRRADDIAPVHEGGQVISTNSVRLAITGRSPFGGAQVKAQWEVKPERTPFDGNGLVESGWQNSGLEGYAFNQVISELAFERRYHWRVRILARPLKSPAASPATYRGRWINGDSFFTALSGTQPISGTGRTQLLGQTAYVDIMNQDGLTSLELRGYPDTAHPLENINGGGSNLLDRYFSLTTNGEAGGYSLTLCLNYDEGELAIPGGGRLSENGLGLCHWTGEMWECLPRGAGSDAGTNLVCADGVSELSDWTMGYAGPTAIDLISLQARSGPAAPLKNWALLGGLTLAAFWGLAVLRARRRARGINK